MENIVWFKDVGKDDIAKVGGKGANLGELTRIGCPVPGGFIVTSGAYFANITRSGALDRMRSVLYGLEVENPVQLAKCAELCQKEIKDIDLDQDLQNDLESAYKKLSGTKDVYVAVRSSATAEDLPEASFAGQQATFLNVKGINNLKKSLLDAWASLFEARAIYYRVQQKFDHFKVGIAIPIQKMVQSETSGVMFTIDPLTNNKGKVVIESVFGLGEQIVSGSTTPDHYEVDKKTLKIGQKNIVIQKKQLIGTHFGNKLLPIARAYQKSQKLSDEKIIELANLGLKIEKHYYFPQDIEWAYEDNQLFIVQTRPVTTIKKIETEKQLPAKSFSSLPVLLEGAPASPLIATGPVVIIKSPKELFKVKKGDVLVTEMTNPDFVPAMKKAAAIVTNKGGRTSHAAIVSRELGIACVVGTENATHILKDGEIITVDGSKGIVYKGLLQKSSKLHESTETKKSTTIHKTATHLYVNLAEPELAHQIAAKNVDGVGLLRAEFMLAQIGTHPKKMIAENRQEEYISQLEHGLATFGKAFGSRPVIYRATDLKSNEYKDLLGGEAYEPKESNPMLGYRGAFRYIKDPDVFKLELEAIKRARKNHKNINLMIPFVRSTQELKMVREIVDEYGLFSDDTFNFYMMAEIPSNVFLLEDFIEVGIDGISIGSNDLTMLILGTDRDNSEVAEEFREMDPAVLMALEKIVKTAIKHKIKCSICGQAPSIFPELTQLLVSWGISSISVNPDVIDNTRQYIYEAEKKLLNN